MPEDKATERPWRVFGKNTGVIMGRDGTSVQDDAIVEVALVGAYHDKEMLPQCKERWDADAKLIVKAVNSHDQLSAIAEEMAGALEEMRNEFCGHDLPYGSKAYHRSGLAIARYRKYKEEQE